MNALPKLYTFWRSSAAYRVRIALGLKGLEREDVFVHFRKEGGQHRKPDFLALNPQGLLPVWQENGWCLSQSQAIIEYLEDLQPKPPLLPQAPRARAEVRALAQIISCDIHPLNNLRILQYLRKQLGQTDESVNAWVRHWIALGLEAFEARLQQTAGRYSYSDQVSLADVCLVPQVYNAERFNCDLDAYPQLRAVAAALRELPAFAAATPEFQEDAE